MALHFLVDEVAGDVVRLTGEEAHHAASVRRVRVGEEVTVGDGRGVWATGRCEAVAPREVLVRVLDRSFVPAPAPRIVLVQALAKGDRDELAIQAATELGVDLVVPWQSARSVSRWDAAKSAKGRARWQSIVREAAKQAHRAWVPEVSEPVRSIDTVAGLGRVIVLEPSAAQALTSLDLHSDPGDRDLVLVVGPEGGIAPEELGALQDAGAHVVRLGDTVLRTSTAGPAALAALNVLLARW